MKQFLGNLIRFYYELKEIRESVKLEKELNRKKLLSSEDQFSNMISNLAYRSKYENLLIEYNKLIDIINKKGGKQFLDHATICQKGLDISQDDLKILIQLCHPDKHNGKVSAVEITKKLLLLRA